MKSDGIGLCGKVNRVASVFYSKALSRRKDNWDWTTGKLKIWNGALNIHYGSLRAQVTIVEDPRMVMLMSNSK